VPVRRYVVVARLVDRRREGLALLGDKVSAELAVEWGLIWRCPTTVNWHSSRHGQMADDGPR
jgi:enoyl-CoA hydratase/carnithine racemase